MDTALNYFYIKVRKDFGKQPRFLEVPGVMLDSINPDKAEKKLYCLRNPVNHETQTADEFSEHYINTKRTILQEQGVHHAEGGWPKDVNYNDEEATTRYRRRFERDDSYIHAVLKSYNKVEHVINQNNAIEMYNMYFKEIKAENPVEKCYVRKNNIFRDPEERPVSCISWTYEENSKLVIAYCNKKYLIVSRINKSLSCLIWDVENPIDPIFEIFPPTACWQIACCPTDSNIIIGGLEDGRVCIFDIRAKKEPTTISSPHLAHRDPVSALLYIPSRLNPQIFSGSADGQCMWWDIRNLSQPIDTIIMSIQIPPGEDISLANAEGVSALQYDKAFPTRFLCGTDTGFVINVNRKGKNHQDVMSGIFQAHKGPVKAVHRNPSTSKMFITCGDWTVCIWNDDIHSSPVIIGAPHRMQVTDVAWCPKRISSYMSICDDGKFRYWDLLRKYHEPVLVLSISKYPLLKIKPSKKKQFVAIGDAKGSVQLISLSKDMMFSGDRDKQLMTQCFERESKRERILETRVKEILIKLKTVDTADSETEIVNEEAFVKSAEDEYKRIVSEEIRSKGTTQNVSEKRGEKHKRLFF